MASGDSESVFDVVVVGAGAAGVGVAVALRDAGIENFVVIERHTVGASFARWPAETRFITPSFPSNSIGMLDLNAIALGTSPAHLLQVEHPSGEEYEVYLCAVAQHLGLPIREHTAVADVVGVDNGFLVHTSRGVLQARHVVWATGEFQFPRSSAFAGSELCRHTATIRSYKDLEGDRLIVVGGYESGIDAAYHLAQLGKRVRVFDGGCPWESDSSDPSVALSTYSLERMRNQRFVEQVELYPNTPIELVEKVDESYEVTARNGDQFLTDEAPLLAIGFESGLKPVAHLFEQRDDGYPLLSEQDESTVAPGLFLCGAAVRHEAQVFCFIYKFRQRLAVVAKAIADSLGLDAHLLEAYRDWGMYLDDLSCCGQECIC